ncbi:MAG: hypothetical protein O7C73_07705 [Nitrospirae bacterium]|nr:hypothetical protein [Nitrospirota bacterium]
MCDDMNLTTGPATIPIEEEPQAKPQPPWTYKIGKRLQLLFRDTIRHLDSGETPKKSVPLTDGDWLDRTWHLRIERIRVETFFVELFDLLTKGSRKLVPVERVGPAAVRPGKARVRPISVLLVAFVPVPYEIPYRIFGITGKSCLIEIVSVALNDHVIPAAGFIDLCVPNLSFRWT